MTYLARMAEARIGPVARQSCQKLQSARQDMEYQRCIIGGDTFGSTKLMQLADTSKTMSMETILRLDKEIAEAAAARGEAAPFTDSIDQMSGRLPNVEVVSDSAVPLSKGVKAREAERS